MWSERRRLVVRFASISGTDYWKVLNWFQVFVLSDLVNWWTEWSENRKKMDSNEFRRRGAEMVEYICKYMETLEDRRVTPMVEPGYLRHLLPDEAPQEPEEWNTIMDDVETKIMPGVTHWQHPRFHAYFPAGNSYPSILGDMLSDGIGCIGFSWVKFAEINKRMARRRS